MYTSQTTNNPGGVTNASPWQTMWAAGTPDPTWSQLFTDDFNQYNAANYSIVGVGTPVVALTAGKGGLLSLTTSAAAGDTTNLQGPIGAYVATPGKHLFFKAALQPINTSAADLYVGLFPVGASPIAATDFLGLVCLTGTRTWLFRSRIASVNTDTPLPAALVVADGTPLELGFHIDIQQNVEVFFNPTTGNNRASSSSSSVFPARVAAMQSIPGGAQNSLTQVALAPTVGLRTTGAAAKQLLVDFLVASSER